MSNVRAIFGVFAGLVAVSAIASLFLGRGDPSRITPPIVGELRDETAERLRASTAVRANNTGSIAETLASSSQRLPRDEPFDESALSGFRMLVAEYIALLARSDADAYVEWMRSRGYIIDPLGMAPEYWDGAHRDVTGQPFRGSTADDLFRSLYVHQMSDPGGLGRLTSVMSSAGEALIATARAEPGEHPLQATLDFTVSEPDLAMKWLGPDLGQGLPFWKPPRGWSELSETLEDLDAATAVVAVQNSTQEIFLVSLTAYRDPADGTWWITNVSVGGSDAYSNDYFFH